MLVGRVGLLGVAVCMSDASRPPGLATLLHVQNGTDGLQRRSLDLCSAYVPLTYNRKFRDQIFKQVVSLSEF